MLSACKSIHSASMLALALLVAPTAIHAAPQAMSHAWGGEGRHVYTWVDPADSSHMRVWTCEDGGRIRYMDTGTGTWSYVSRPTHTPPLQSLLGIYTPDGTNVFAVGQEGQFLSSTGPTGPWTLQTSYEDPGTQNHPARLWGVRYFSATGIGFLSGEHVLRSTQSGGMPTTEPVFVNPGYSMDELEFYGMGIVGTSSDFIAVALAEGEIRDTSGVEVNFCTPPAVCHKGVGAFWTSSADKDPSTNAYSWTECTFTFLDNEMLHEDFEAWEVAFVPGASDPDTAVGYMVGGVGNTLFGRFFKTCNGGKHWVEEPQDDPTSLDDVANSLYGVHAFADGSAIACGYGGQVWLRLAEEEDELCENREWTKVLPTVEPDICDPYFDFSGPLTGVSGNAGSGSSGTAWMIGTWGFLYKTTDKGATWTQEVNEGGPEWRLSDVHFQNDQVGWLAGQAGIGMTSDGGATWSEEACLLGEWFRPSIAFSSSGYGVAVGSHYSPSSTGPVVHYRVNSSGVAGWTDVPHSSDDDLNLRGVQWAENETFFAVGNHSSAAALIRLKINSQGSPPMYSVTWNTLTAPSGNPKLTDLALCNGDTLFVAGSNAAGTEGRIYRAVFTGGYTSGTLGSWTDVTPVPASDAGTCLNAIDATGSSPSIDAIAVGNGGVALRWNRNIQKFDCISGVYQTASSTCGAATPMTTRNLFAVAIAADSGSNSVFIGGRDGILIRRTSGTWAKFDSHTSKFIYAFSFPASSPLYGFAVGQSDPNFSGTNLGIIADSILLKYE